MSYTTEEETVGNQSTIDVLMLPDVQSLSEVVVVEYGNQERAKVSSAITSVSGEEIADLPVATPEQALQGRVPGVNIAGSGDPGRTMPKEMKPSPGRYLTERLSWRERALILLG